MMGGVGTRGIKGSGDERHAIGMNRLMTTTIIEHEQVNPILEICASATQTMVQTVVRHLRTADRSGGPVQSKIGPVWPVRDFQTGLRQHYPQIYARCFTH